MTLIDKVRSRIPESNGRGIIIKCMKGNQEPREKERSERAKVGLLHY